MRYLKLTFVFMVAFSLSNSAFSGWFGADEAVVEKAWACGATRKNRMFTSSKQLKPSEIFQFPKCNNLSEREINEFGEELLQKYASIDNQSTQWDLSAFAAAGHAMRVDNWHRNHPSENILEKARECQPSQRPGMGDIVPVGADPADIFQFAACPSLLAEEQEVLSEELFYRYSMKVNNGMFSLAAFSQEKRSLLEARARILAAERQDEMTRAENEKAKEAKEAKEAEDAEAALHQQQLKEGLIRPQNMQDVWLLYKTGDTDGVKNLHRVMAGTLLQPDNAIYGAQVEIDSQESSGVLLAKFEPGSFLTKPGQTIVEAAGDANLMIFASKLTGKAVPPELQNGTRHYAQLNRNKATVNFSPNLRIGSSVWVVGRYKANRKYRMTNGASRTMPVLDVLYIGE